MQTDLSIHTSRRRALPDPVAFVLLASILVGFLAASAAPTPLYATYAVEWHFSAITTTVVFGVYALAVLAALLVVGRLSDHVGRRPLLLAALALQGVAMVVFEVADGVPMLFAARIVQGLATGAAAGAIGAALVDLDAGRERPRGALANAVSAPIGTGSGALVAGLVVQFLPAPTHLVYAILLGLFAVQALGVLLMRETVQRTDGAARSLVPHFALPAAARSALLIAVPALVAAWALPSYYASLGPALTRSISGSSSVVLGTLPLFLLTVGALPAIIALRNTRPERVMLLGAIGLVIGVGLTLVAVAADDVTGFFAASVLSGAGFGAAFQGAIRTVLPLAGERQRAGLLSLLYIVSYVALGVPAMIGGVLTARGGDLRGVAIGYGLAVVALAVLAVVGLARRLGRPEVEHTFDELEASMSDSDDVTPQAEKATADWVTGDEPMTGPQHSYLHTLTQEAGERAREDLTKAEASDEIERLQAVTGRG